MQENVHVCRKCALKYSEVMGHHGGNLLPNDSREKEALWTALTTFLYILINILVRNFHENLKNI